MIPLSYALLGLLARAPRSGYDLLQLMEEPMGFFWSARRSQQPAAAHRATTPRRAPCQHSASMWPAAAAPMHWPL